MVIDALYDVVLFRFASGEQHELSDSDDQFQLNLDDYANLQAAKSTDTTNHASKADRAAVAVAARAVGSDDHDGSGDGGIVRNKHADDARAQKHMTQERGLESSVVGDKGGADNASGGGRGTRNSASATSTLKRPPKTKLNINRRRFSGAHELFLFDEEVDDVSVDDDSRWPPNPMAVTMAGGQCSIK